MKQVVQDLRSGDIRLVDVPAPLLAPGGVLVRLCHSVISVGTERSKVDLGRKSLLGKARERPDQVRQVLDSVRRDGLSRTYRKVRSRLNALSPFGYSCAGIIEGVGDGVVGLREGQRVACAGAGYASHAERVWVPSKLVVPVPDDVPLDHAAFATLGAIAMQGVRQAEAKLGEVVGVIGLGIIGQLTVQLLRAAGAQPIGIDVDGERVRIARRSAVASVERSGDVEGTVAAVSGGRGADAVILTASTSSDDPIRLAARIARDRARIVVVGALPISAPRAAFYDKELELRLSRSYGPGRYDPSYEEKGHDYPVGYVRWTEQRNLEEFVRLLATGSLDLDSLITARYPLARAEEAYAKLHGSGRQALGIVLDYPTTTAEPEPRRIVVSGGRGATGGVGVGLVGAGSFALSTLVPALRHSGAALRGVVTASGLSARSAAENHGFAYAASAMEELLADPEIGVIVVATRHADHARLAAAALRAGKAVFVEKPPALDATGLQELVDAAAESGGQLMVGYNRRFAPATRLLRKELAGVAGARVVSIRVNAGAVPPGSWVHDPEIGGGRWIGEGCHFVDLAMHLVGAEPVEVFAAAVGAPDAGADLEDNVQVTLRFEGGSLATILYTSKGDARAGKERLEVFAGGCLGVIDDFRRAEITGTARGRWRGPAGQGPQCRGARVPGRGAHRGAFPDPAPGGGCRHARDAGGGALAAQRTSRADMSARDPLVSIVVDNHNYARFLGEAIDSALAQTYAPLEVVVVDDGSTDDSREVIARYGSRVVAVLQENAGQASALATGLRHSHGERVLFLDADDALEPEAIERCVAAWTPGLAKVQFRYLYVDEAGRPIGALYPSGPMPSGDLRKWVLDRGRFPSPGTCGNLFDRAVLERLLPMPACRSPDGYLVIAAALLGDVVSLDAALCRVRIHGSNYWAMDRFDPMRVRDYVLFDQENEAALRILAAELGMELASEWVLRNASHAQARLASLRLDPRAHPVKRDTRFGLMRRGIATAIATPSFSWRKRALSVGWFFLTAALPARAAKRLVEWSYMRARRPPILDRLLGG